jgi:CoA:oxalate CoA-transferase
VADLPHPVLGHAPTVGQPVRFDGAKPVAATSAPALGADGAEILHRLGIHHG